MAPFVSNCCARDRDAVSRAVCVCGRHLVGAEVFGRDGGASDEKPLVARWARCSSSRGGRGVRRREVGREVGRELGRESGFEGGVARSWWCEDSGRMVVSVRSIVCARSAMGLWVKNGRGRELLVQEGVDRDPVHSESRPCAQEIATLCTVNRDPVHSKSRPCAQLVTSSPWWGPRSRAASCDTASGWPADRTRHRC